MKQYIIRKYVKANTIQEALKLDKTSQIDDCVVDESYEEINEIGFKETNQKKTHL